MSVVRYLLRNFLRISVVIAAALVSIILSSSHLVIASTDLSGRGNLIFCGVKESLPSRFCAGDCFG